jgi:hypothetical protein
MGLERGSDTLGHPEYRTAWPESELISRITGECFGYVYIWCNGERSPFWLNEPEEDAQVVSLSPAD